MSENIRSTNLRFSLDKDVENRAGEYLQTMDKKRFKSYSQIIAISLVDYFDRYYKKQDWACAWNPRKRSAGIPSCRCGKRS